MEYGREMLSHRKMLNGYLYRDKIKEYVPIQQEHSRATLGRLLDNPSGYADILLQYVFPWTCVPAGGF